MIDLKETIGAERISFTIDLATYRARIETSDGGRNRNPFITDYHVDVPQLPNISGCYFHANLFECFLQRLSEHSTIFHVANTVGSSFEVSQKFFLSSDLPTGAGAIVPLVNGRHYWNFSRSVKFRDTVQTIANHFDLLLQLCLVIQLLKVAASAASEVRTRWFNSNS